MTEHYSWLRLEQYTLGELTATERGAVAAHANDCVHCRQRLEAIGSDVRELAPLRAVATAQPRRRAVRAWWLGFAAATAAAALVVLVWSRGQLNGAGSWAEAVDDSTVRGGDTLVVDVVRERNGVIGSARSFRPSDRWKVVVTCGRMASSQAELFVAQGGQRQSLWTTRRFRCGNRVELPAAFQIDGSLDAEICVRLQSDLRHRSATQCVVLRSE